MNRVIAEVSDGTTGVLASGEVRASDNTISVHLISGTTPNVVVELSNDNTNWVSASGVAVGYQGASTAALTTANTMLAYMVQSRYWRIRATAGSNIALVAVAGYGRIK